MFNRPKPLVLLILDGFGHREEKENNAIAMAKTPCWEKLLKNSPNTLLDCAGDSVGLPSRANGKLRSRTLAYRQRSLNAARTIQGKQRNKRR